MRLDPKSGGVVKGVKSAGAGVVAVATAGGAAAMNVAGGQGPREAPSPRPRRRKGARGPSRAGAKLHPTASSGGGLADGAGRAARRLEAVVVERPPRQRRNQVGTESPRAMRQQGMAGDRLAGEAAAEAVDAEAGEQERALRVEVERRRRRDRRRKSSRPRQEGEICHTCLMDSPLVCSA